MKITEHLRQLLLQKLSTHRILVWYDGERAFGDFVAALDLPTVNIISASESALRAIRKAQELYRQMEKPDARLSDKNANLVIYVPRPRETDSYYLPEQAFENFTHIGAAFGDKEAEQLKSLAMQALPEFRDQIERMFQEGHPTLEMLDQLEKSPAYPLVNQVFGTRSAVEVATLILGDSANLQKINKTAGCTNETLRLLADELGFVPSAGANDWNARRTLLARYVLFNEFVFDLQATLPAALANLPQAPQEFRERIEAIADRLRDSHQFRETYLELALSVEHDLELPRYFDGLELLGQRDTFSWYHA